MGIELLDDGSTGRECHWTLRSDLATLEVVWISGDGIGDLSDEKRIVIDELTSISIPMPGTVSLGIGMEEQFCFRALPGRISEAGLQRLCEKLADGLCILRGQAPLPQTQVPVLCAKDHNSDGQSANTMLAPRLG